MIQDGFFPDSCQETALRRRGMYAPYFSREAIRGAEPRVAACVAKFLDNLNHFAQNGKSVDMTKGVMCYTMDGIMNFIYQKPFGALDAEDFDSDYVLPMEDFVDTLQWSKYFPRLFGRLYKLTDMLPEWGLERSLKGLLTTKKMLKVNALISILKIFHLYAPKSTLQFARNNFTFAVVRGKDDLHVIPRTLKQYLKFEAFAKLRANDIDV